jgi:hypothetical protein
MKFIKKLKQMIRIGTGGGGGGRKLDIFSSPPWVFIAKISTQKGRKYKKKLIIKVQ